VPGPKGDTGTVDTSNFYTKSDSDGRFLGLNDKAADSAQLDGLESSRFLKESSSAAGTVQGGGAFTILTVPGHGELRASCANPSQPTVTWRNTSGGDERLYVDDGGATATFIDPVADGTEAGTVTGSATPGTADHVVYMVRGPGAVWIDVFANPTGGSCFFFSRAYGASG